MFFELASANFITTCLIVFGAFTVLRMTRTYLEGWVLKLKMERERLRSILKELPSGH